ncbi:MAG: hypothetical protein J5793_03050 [Clostridia bacterium]|nr:hypothetical protein [Clostridia bacterium]
MKLKYYFIDLFRSHRKKIITAAVLIAAVAVTVTVIAVASANGVEPPADPEAVNSALLEELFDGIPEFPGEAYKTEAKDGAAVFYYSGVTGESVAQYAEKLYSEKGIDLRAESYIYPRSAVYGDRVIAISYNATEQNFSITVTKAAD